MKIFIIGHNLTNGGAERVSALWADGFASEGHDVTLVLSDDAPVTYGVDKSISIKSIACSKSGLVKQLYRFRKLRKLIRAERPDVIIGIVEMQTLLAYLASFGLHKHIKFVKTEHNSFERPVGAPMSFKNKFFKFCVNRIYDNVTVLTHADKQCIGDRLKHVTVLPNPLAFAQISHEELSRKKKVVIAAGRLNEWYVKGFDVLLEAWSKAKQNISDEWKLLIAGQGDDESSQYLESLCTKFKVTDSVEFIGYKENIIDYYKQASVFVLSSRYEGFGMVLIEAMSQGCAVVSCDYKGRQREIVHDAGLLCPTDDAETLANQLCEIIANEPMRIDLQNKAIEQSKAYDLKNIMRHWSQI